MKKPGQAKKAKKPETELRRRAGARMKTGTRDISGMQMDDAKDLLHELEIDQAELEIQTEDLRISQVELAEARDNYVELYENAPVGLLTLDWGRKIHQHSLPAGETNQ